MPAHYGLNLYQKAPTSFDDWLEQAREAARKRKPGGTPPGTPPPVNQLQPPPIERQCDFVGKSLNGARCKKWALKGATRCGSHGGYRQNPAHKGSVRLVKSGKADEVKKARDLRQRQRLDPEAQAMRQTLRDIGIIATPQNVEEALQAQQDDTGRAWRRWTRAKRAERARNDLQTKAARQNSKKSQQNQNLGHDKKMEG